MWLLQWCAWLSVYCRGFESYRDNDATNQFLTCRYQILKQLSDKLIRSVMPFDRVLPEKYNAIQCHSGTKPAHGVINGDIIELIGAMNNDEVQELITGVVDVAKAAVTVEQVVRLVEDLSRSH